MTIRTNLVTRMTDHLANGNFVIACAYRTYERTNMQDASSYLLLKYKITYHSTKPSFVFWWYDHIMNRQTATPIKDEEIIRKLFLEQ